MSEPRRSSAAARKAEGRRTRAIAIWSIAGGIALLFLPSIASYATDHAGGPLGPRRPIALSASGPAGSPIVFDVDGRVQTAIIPASGRWEATISAPSGSDASVNVTPVLSYLNVSCDIAADGKSIAPTGGMPMMRVCTAAVPAAGAPPRSASGH